MCSRKSKKAKVRGVVTGGLGQGREGNKCSTGDLLSSDTVPCDALMMYVGHHMFIEIHRMLEGRVKQYKLWVLVNNNK